MTKGSFRAALGAILLSTLVLAAPAGAYYVMIEYYVYASHSDGLAIALDEYFNGLAYMDGEHTKTGDYGNYGYVWFEADMAEGCVKAHAHTYGMKISTYDIASGTGRAEKVAFGDRLSFTVPAGTYPDGVTVRALGGAYGTITSDLGAGAEAHPYANLGAAEYDPGLLTVSYDEAGTIVVNDVLDLADQIVTPGTTYTSPREITRGVTAQMIRGRTWAPGFNPGGGSVTGHGDIDFRKGIWFTEIVVPEGVTWVSESGLFLSGPSAVPDARVPTQGMRLYQNRPNPFNPTTTIAFDLARGGPVHLRVYDLAGGLVRTLLAGEFRGEGPGEARWDGRDEAGRGVATGVYFYRLEIGSEVATRRMVLVR